MLSPVWGLITWYILGFFTVALSALLLNVLRENVELKRQIETIKAENDKLKESPLERVLERVPTTIGRTRELFDAAVTTLDASVRAFNTVYGMWTEINRAHNN
jgi:hypothetical protein